MYLLYPYLQFNKQNEMKKKMKINVAAALAFEYSSNFFLEIALTVAGKYPLVHLSKRSPVLTRMEPGMGVAGNQLPSVRLTLLSKKVYLNLVEIHVLNENNG